MSNTGDGEQGTPPNERPQPDQPQSHEPQYGRRARQGQDQWGAYGQQDQGQHEPGQHAYGAGPYGQAPPSHSPYGQNPYAQEPSAPNPYTQPGYGQAGYGQAGYGQAGYSQPAGVVPPEKPRRPGPLTVSMALQLAAGALLAILGLVSGARIIGAHPTQLLTSDQWAEFGFTVAELEEMGIMTAAGVTIIIGALIFAIPYWILAFTSTRGSQAGRVVATIYLALSIFSVLFGFANLLVVFLPSLVALILLWVPSSTAYVRQVQAFKRARAMPAGQAPPQGPGAPGVTGAPGSW